MINIVPINRICILNLLKIILLLHKNKISWISEECMWKFWEIDQWSTLIYSSVFAIKLYDITIYAHIYINLFITFLYKNPLEKNLFYSISRKILFIYCYKNKIVHCKFMSDNCINYWVVYIFNRGLFFFFFLNK